MSYFHRVPLCTLLALTSLCSLQRSTNAQEVPPPAAVPNPESRPTQPGEVSAPAPSQAPDQEVPSGALPPRIEERKWGLGTAVGGGFAFAQVNGTSALSPAFLLPSFEMGFFRSNGHSIDLSIPIVNTLFVAQLSGFRTFVFSIDAFYNFNLGPGRVRFLIGPGLGLAFGVSSGAFFGLRLPAEVGVEFMTRARGFGFKILARPWLQIETATGASGAFFGGGLMAALGFSFYKTRD